MRLTDPERGWSAPSRKDLDLAGLVESRLGRVVEPVALLAGGQANLNVRVGGDRVLRVYERDPEFMARERALLGRRWRNLRVPRVLDGGDDYLLLEYVALRPLRDSALQGEAVGAAAAEIHGLRFERAGLLGPDLTVRHALPEVGAYLRERITGLGAEWERLEEPILARWREVESAGHSPDRAILNHGDFKLSNLFVGPRDEVVVLDWEFAFAGPALMDLGQLFRWRTSEEFRSGFERGYTDQGGVLPTGWERRAAVLDLVNLVGLARPAHQDPRRHTDLLARVAATLTAGVEGGGAGEARR